MQKSILLRRISKCHPSSNIFQGYGKPIASMLCLTLICLSAVRADPPVSTPVPKPAAAPLGLTVLAGEGTENPVSTLARYSFGDASVLSTTPIKHTFRLRNDSAAPVTLERLQASCGCTSAVAGGTSPKTPPFVVASGEEVQINVSVDPTHLAPGNAFKDVWVFLQGQAAPAATLEMVGMVQPAASFSPTVADFGRVSAQNAKSILLTVTLDPRLSKTGKPPHLVSSDPNISITLLPEKATGKGAASGETHLVSAKNDASLVTQRYRIALVPRPRLGVLSAALSLLVPAGNNGSVQTPVGATVPVVGEVMGDVSATPGAAVFGSVTAGKSAVMSVTLFGAASDTLRNLKVFSASPFISAVLGKTSSEKLAVSAGLTPLARQSAARNSCTLTLSASPKMPPGTLQTQVIITTAKGEQLVVPIFISAVRQ